MPLNDAESIICAVLNIIKKKKEDGLDWKLSPSLIYRRSALLLLEERPARNAPSPHVVVVELIDGGIRPFGIAFLHD